MSDDDNTQRRSYYRLRYFAEIEESPYVEIDGLHYRLVELSEGGARIAAGEKSFSERTEIRGRIHFDDVDYDTFEATVLRVERTEIVVRFFRGIGLKRMIDEQRRMRLHYPHLYSPKLVA
ncbi:MAG: PilZ domain-containing protein [Thiotrichales bacterium]